jgi:hypothetical protein
LPKTNNPLFFLILPRSGFLVNGIGIIRILRLFGVFATEFENGYYLCSYGESPSLTSCHLFDNACFTSVLSLEALGMEINISPNPLTQSSTIQIKNPLGLPVQIEFFDLLGRNLLQSAAFTNFEIPVEALPKGILLVNFKINNERVHSVKLINH